MAAFIRGRLFFKGALYSMASFIRGRLLFEEGFYSMAAEGGVYSSTTFI